MKGIVRLFTLTLITFLVIAIPPITAQKTVVVKPVPNADNRIGGGVQRALLIGINNYDDPDITPLRFCVNDIKEFYNILVNPSIGGFNKENVFLMTDQHQGTDSPNANNIIYRLEQLSQVTKPEDSFIFYFSGHGILHDDIPFLLGINSDARTLSTLKKSALELTEIREIISRIQARQIVLILDVCRNMPTRARGGYGEDNLLQERFWKGIMVEPVIPEGGKAPVIATWFSCSQGERAYEFESLDHGVFSYFLLEGLQKKVAQDEKGRVVGHVLTEYIEKEMRVWFEKDLSSKKQTPWFKQRGGTELILAQARTALGRPSSSLGVIDIQSPEGAEVLLYGDSTGNQLTPKKAIDALAEIGQPALPTLIKTMGNEDSDVRRRAASALRKIGEPAVPALIKALRDKNSSVRDGAAYVLGNIGEPASDVVPALIQALRDEDSGVRSSVAFALGYIGKPASDDVPAL
ncbi:caspase family protein, partial [Candidatus Poribacteria bacterium]|nr:caspase family protein [Candidatus Poribacteria bacterium]